MLLVHQNFCSVTRFLITFRIHEFVLSQAIATTLSAKNGFALLFWLAAAEERIRL